MVAWPPELDFGVNRATMAAFVSTQIPLAPEERNVYRGVWVLLLAPEERHLAGADAAPPELKRLS